MPQKPTCYISYARDAEILNFLVRLKSEIEKKSQNKVNVILDRKDFKVGEDFKRKEKQILESDLILIFFTPEYKKKVDTPIENSGCFREFNYIIEKRNEDERYIYPFLFKGNIESSIPRDLRNVTYNFEASTIKYKDSKKNYISIEPKCISKFNKLVMEIIKKAKTNYTLSDIRYIDFNEKYQSLLKNTASNGTLKRSCMIKMPAYNAIINQSSYFVIGRKGSGKTTLLETIENLEPDVFTKRYKILSPINAEDISINSIYSCAELLWNDKDFISTSEITDLYWEIFFVIQTMFTVSLEFENKNLDTDFRYRDFKSVAKFLREKLGVSKDINLIDNNVKRQLPILVLEIMESYFKNHILDNANSCTFITSIKTNLNAENIITTFMGLALFKKFCTAFSFCQKKTLISLDGFDTHSEDFRRNTRSLKTSKPDEYIKRNEFECLFYRSLVNVVMRFKENKNSSLINLVASNVDFCIVLPQDRLDQIRKIDRDISKMKCCGLFWDAYDLLKMLVLRLEENYDVTPSNSQNMLQRFHRILKEKLPQIPNSVEVSVGDRKYEFDLFNYILRLSFWRPRDILLNFISLLELVENSENIGLDIDDKMIKDALTQSASKIIDEEFLQEYQNVFYNLKDVLNSFRGFENIIPISDFFNIIDKIKFDASFSYDCNNPKNKLLILYQLGVIGLRFDIDSIANRGYTHHICFNFNEGLNPIYDTIIDRDTITNDAEIIINPLFCKKFYISINTSELIGNYEWSYIDKLAAEKTLKRRF